MTRQQQYQQRQAKKGKCRSCAKTATKAGFCPDHYARHKESSRNSYRKKAGIAKDAPPQKRGRKPVAKLVLDCR